MTKTLEQSDKTGLKLVYRGKVRDMYEVDAARLLLVATDRISAFDFVLPTPVPEKGRLLTQISAFWFKKTAGIVPNHLISADLPEIRRQLPRGANLPEDLYDGRVMLARKAKRVDAECVVRGYLVGSGWKEYQKTGMVCGHKLPKGLQQASRLPEPIFTPSTKADTGHDENITRAQLAELVGADLAKELEAKSLALYKAGCEHAETRGLILADTKFEFGFIDGKLSVIDEMLTPDSSRFWDKAAYKVGTSPESFDKQFVRDHLERIGWDKKPPVPPLPPEVVRGTTERYREAFRRVAS